MTKYDENKEEYLFKVEHYKKQGISDKQVAHNMGIAYSTFNLWRKKHLEFSEAYKKGRVQIIEQLENATFKKALGYEYDEVTVEVKGEGENERTSTKTVTKHIPPDPTALIFLLTNLDNEKYKRNPDLTNKEEEQEGFGESKFVD